MIVTFVMVAVCVVGVIGAIASVIGYDKPYGEIGAPMRIPKRSSRGARASRPSRQLRALEAALEEEAPAEQAGSCAEVRSHSRWRTPSR